MNTITMNEPQVSVVARLTGLARQGIRVLNSLSPVADLLLRLWVAHAFFVSGLTKIQSWDSTIALFTYEYQVPLLSPVFAAVSGTFTELFFPLLLAAGLATRLGAFVLFVFNIIAVISYPDLGAAGIRDHQVWGLMLLVIMLHGPGKIAIDHFIERTIVRGGRQ